MVKAREVVICGLKGYKNKCERRQKAGDNFDRKAGKTVQVLERQHGSRVRRKKKRWAASRTSRGEGSQAKPNQMEGTKQMGGEGKTESNP